MQLTPRKVQLAARSEPSDSWIDEVVIAMRAHRAWLARWHRHAVCRATPDPDLVAEDAHRLCRFGRWYERFRHRSGAPTELVAQIDRAHDALHAEARRLSSTIMAGGSIDPREYDAFGHVAEQFARAMVALERCLRAREADRDPLTGVNSRRAMLSRLEHERQWLAETGRSACLAMLDVDRFKEVNDRGGHLAGDDALRMVASCLRDLLRAHDLVFRYGGDEFLVCLTDIDVKTATIVLERVRDKISHLAIGEPQITVSIGLSSLDPDVPLEVSIAHADRGLYAAKRAGRDRIHMLATS